MAFNNAIKVQVDLPVWEWMRFTPAGTTALCCQTAAAAKANIPRFIYTMFGTVPAFYRYDTYSDSWQQLMSSPTAALTTVAMTYSAIAGYYGKVISCPSSST